MLRVILFIGAMLTANAAVAAESLSSQHYELRAMTLAEGLDHPWGLAFCPAVPCW